MTINEKPQGSRQKAAGGKGPRGLALCYSEDEHSKSLGARPAPGALGCLLAQNQHPLIYRLRSIAEKAISNRLA